MRILRQDSMRKMTRMLSSKADLLFVWWKGTKGICQAHTDGCIRVTITTNECIHDGLLFFCARVLPTCYDCARRGGQLSPVVRFLLYSQAPGYSNVSILNFFLY
jgi:hypothetical protein